MENRNEGISVQDVVQGEDILGFEGKKTGVWNPAYKASNSPSMSDTVALMK